MIVNAHYFAQSLADFWQKHPEAERPLRGWYSIASKSNFVNYFDLRSTFASADYVPPFTIFDVGGNNYRIIAIIRYRDQKIFVRWVMTHREYDEWNKLYRKGKLKS